MKHCTLPTLLAVKTTILLPCRAAVPAKNGKNSDTGKVCIAYCIRRNLRHSCRLVLYIFQHNFFQWNGNNKISLLRMSLTALSHIF